MLAGRFDISFRDSMLDAQRLFDRFAPSRDKTLTKTSLAALFAWLLVFIILALGHLQAASIQRAETWLLLAVASVGLGWMIRWVTASAPATSVHSIGEGKPQSSEVLFTPDQPPARQRDLLSAALQATVNATVNATVITDAHGWIVWVTPAFSRLTGYQLEEGMGQNPRILKAGHNSATFYQGLWQTITSGQVWRTDVIANRRKDGTQYTEQMTITPVTDAAGPHSKITVMTAHALEGDRALYLAGGMDDTISKPVRIETLVESLERLADIDQAETHKASPGVLQGEKIQDDIP